jgi:hypothetical protein
MRIAAGKICQSADQDGPAAPVTASTHIRCCNEQIDPVRICRSKISSRYGRNMPWFGLSAPSRCI